MKWIVLIIVLVSLVGIYALNAVWAPLEVDYLEWITFFQMSLLSLGAISFLAFLFYRSFYYRSVRLNRPSDVFKLRRPWVTCMWFALLLQGVVGSLVGFAVISERTLLAFVHIVSFALIQGIVSSLLYWVLSAFLALPKRVKYVPFLTVRRM